MRRQFVQLVSEADVADFERIIGGGLPADYRAFLLEYNGGEPENACFTLLNNVGSYKESIVRYFFSISDSPKFSLAYHYDIYVKANRVPQGSLPIGCDFGDNLILLKIVGDGKGEVYFWDHELEGIEENPNDPRHLEILGASFNDFCARLTEEK